MVISGTRLTSIPRQRNLSSLSKAFLPYGQSLQAVTEPASSVVKMRESATRKTPHISVSTWELA